MANFTLRAYPAWRHSDRLGASTMSLPMQALGDAHRFGARNLTAIGAAVAAFGRRIAADSPDASFGIAVIIDRRDRKPNGFDTANRRDSFGQDAWIQERDRDGNPLPATLPATSSPAASNAAAA